MVYPGANFLMTARGELLPVRLEPDESPQAMAGCAFLIAAILMGLGGFFIYMDVTHSRDGFSLPSIVGGGFALVGFFVLIGGIQRSLASRAPQTILEIEEEVLERGSTIRGAVIQNGPVDLQSLRVNLVCLRITTRTVRRNGHDERDRTTQEIFTVNVFESAPLVMREGERFQQTFEIAVPDDAVPSGNEKRDTVISWRLEAWGGGSFRNRFMHPFTVVVS